MYMWCPWMNIDILSFVKFAKGGLVGGFTLITNSYFSNSLKTYLEVNKLAKIVKIGRLNFFVKYENLVDINVGAFEVCDGKV